MYIILLFIFILIISIYFTTSKIPWVSIRDTIVINTRVLKAINKALIYPLKKGWKDFASQNDAQNLQLFHKLKQKYGSTAKVIILGKPVTIILSPKIMYNILDNSPTLYGPGQFKISYFDPIMPNNVGINYTSKWVINRPFNENVLGFRQPNHPIYRFIDLKTPKIIDKIIKYKVLKGDIFFEIGKWMSYLITFGEKYTDEKYLPAVWNYIEESIYWRSLYGIDPVSTDVRKIYNDFMNNQLNKPEPDSLMHWAKKMWTPKMSKNDVIDQVPHWIFPLSNAMLNLFSTYLVLLNTFPQIKNKVLSELHLNTERRDTWLHWTVLETIRMYGIVLTLTRTSMNTSTVVDENGCTHVFTAGEQLFMLTSVLSNNPDCFIHSTKWIPERWRNISEDSKCDVIFNIGPQICPGSNLVQYLLKSIIKHFLVRVNWTVNSPKLNSNNLPEAIDPWDIIINIVKT